MGIRGELYSTKVSLENRTYFFNVKENRVGDLYLNIVESKNKDAGGFDRQSVVLFADDLQDFLKGFEDSLRVMEKAVREKKKTDRPAAQGRFDRERPDRSDRDVRNSEHEHKGRGDKPFDRGARPERAPGEKPRKSHGDRPFTRDEGGFKGRGGKTFDRTDRGSKKPGDRPFNRDEGGFKPRGDVPSDSSFGRKKFVKAAGKHTVGTHGIKGPLHKNRIVKAVHRRDLPED